jgi:hypothetical protein
MFRNTLLYGIIWKSYFSLISYVKEQKQCLSFNTSIYTCTDGKCLEYRQHNAVVKLEKKQSGIWHCIVQKKRSAGRAYERTGDSITDVL